MAPFINEVKGVNRLVSRSRGGDRAEQGQQRRAGAGGKAIFFRRAFLAPRDTTTFGFELSKTIP
jgi:hypothetical protein